jgi:hypothetical protein
MDHPMRYFQALGPNVTVALMPNRDVVELRSGQWFVVDDEVEFAVTGGALKPKTPEQWDRSNQRGAHIVTAGAP